MDPKTWERIQEIFHRAADLPGPDRLAFVQAETADAPELMDEVMALLAEDGLGDTPLDRSLPTLAEEVLATEPRSLDTVRFGPYRIIRVLGEGGMGVVYLGRRDDLGSEVAIKVLRDAWLSPSRRERFLAEQRLLAQLNHPAIAQLHDAGTLEDGTPWFVMELVHGVPIAEYCQTKHADLGERLRLYRLVAEAVAHAHRHAIVHRDLKPSNILVTPEGRVKLLDFGIAKQLETLDDPAQATRTGLRLMTPAYAAPEQFRGTGIGVHTDVYSLGVVLYELLAGRLPFDLAGKTLLEAETQVLETPPKPSLVAWLKALPGDTRASASAWADLDVLCLTAMHREAERRYRTVDALIRDLDHFTAGEPLDARPDSFGYRLSKFVSRNRRGVAAGVATLVTVAALVTFYTWRLRAARDAALAETARAERIQSFTMRLFQGGDDAVGPADSMRVITLLDRGVKEARSLGQDPRAQSELYLTLGSIFEQLGQFARADTLLTAAAAVQRSYLDDANVDLAPTLLATALLRTREAKYPEALELAKQARGLVRSLPRSNSLVGRAHATVGRVLYEQGEYDSALVALDSAVMLLDRGDSVTTEFTEVLSELANTHFYAGHYATSDSLNRRVLALSRRLYGDRHPHVGDDLINLGAIQFEQGKYPEAERYYREALDIFRGWYGNENPETGSALTMLARAQVNQQRYDDAAIHVTEALAIYRKAYGRRHPRVASAQNELGRIAQRQGRLDDAERAYRDMAAIYREIYDDKHYLIGVAFANLAGVYHDRRDYAQAVTLFRESLRRYTETLEPGHQLLGIGRIRLGRSLLALRDFQGAAEASQAGYDILMKQAEPPASWLDNARADLTQAYRALGRVAEADRYAGELKKP
jgi:tetratricopeptide (TPR) repeat protein